MRWLIVLALLTIGCGGSPTSPSPLGPSPSPASTPAPAPAPTFTGTVTDTVTGAPIDTYTVSLSGTRVTVSAAGYLTRETRNGASVDLIRDAAPFSLSFYRAFVRNDADTPGVLQPVRRLTQAPALYLQSTGLSAATITTLEHAARQAVYDFSGRTMGAVTFEHGPELRPDLVGWIIIELVPSVADEDWCGRAFVGAAAGHVRLNVDPRFLDRSRATGCYRPLAHTLAHEIGHAMGFYHLADSQSLMSGTRPLSHNGLASDLERYHAAIAYKRPVGNRDVDVDPTSFSGVSAVQIVVD